MAKKQLKIYAYNMYIQDYKLLDSHYYYPKSFMEPVFGGDVPPAGTYEEGLKFELGKPLFTERAFCNTEYLSHFTLNSYLGCEELAEIEDDFYGMLLNYGKLLINSFEVKIPGIGKLFRKNVFPVTQQENAILEAYLEYGLKLDALTEVSLTQLQHFVKTSHFKEIRQEQLQLL